MNEGFIKLFKNIHQFEESRHADVLASLKGWFKRILVNTCIDHYRKNASYINGQMLSEDAENIADKQETGIDILSHDYPTPGIWGRVVGDALDLTLLGFAAKKTRKPGGLMFAFAMVAAITALDALCAGKLTADPSVPRRK